MKPLTIQSYFNLSQEESLLYSLDRLRKNVRAVKRQIASVRIEISFGGLSSSIILSLTRLVTVYWKYITAERSLKKLIRDISYNVREWDALTFDFDLEEAKQEHTDLVDAKKKFQTILDRLYKMPTLYGGKKIISLTSNVISKLDELLACYDRMFSISQDYTLEELQEMDAYWEKYKKQNPEHFKILQKDRTGGAYFHKDRK